MKFHTEGPKKGQKYENRVSESEVVAPDLDGVEAEADPDVKRLIEKGSPETRRACERSDGSQIFSYVQPLSNSMVPL